MPELVLRVVGARVRRIERQELLELGDRQDQRFGRALAEIGVADAELRVGPERALRVGFVDLLEVLARGQPLLRSRAPRCRARRGTDRAACVPAGTAAPPAGRTGRADASREHRDQARAAAASRDLRHLHRMSTSHRCSAASPCFEVDGRRETRDRRAPASCRRRCAACRPSAAGSTATIGCAAGHASDHLEHLVDRDPRAASDIVHAPGDAARRRQRRSRSPHRPRT